MIKHLTESCSSALRTKAARARCWQDSTGVGSKDWFSFPYVGAPWNHSCQKLRSEKLSVSVIVPVWNSASTIDMCLRGISKSSLNRLSPSRLEVIVCDDGSSDGSWEVIESRDTPLNLTALRLEHAGQSAALNIGLAHASGDVVVFCDSDIILGCGALDELAARHERWAEAVCFGFRSNIPHRTAADGSLWDLMHREAFSGDNRVTFDLPTLVPNLLLANGWLSDLGADRFMLDSQGMEWHRHRFAFGCLFSASRERVADFGGFPDSLKGWGYGDTLVAARLEANGGFLLPVACAWGHHVEHQIRHPEQWFQMRRNHLAYRYLLNQPEGELPWRGQVPNAPAARVVRSGRPEELQSKETPICSGAHALLGLGLWEDCLGRTSEVTDGDALAAECLFQLGRDQDVVASGGGANTLWGALSHWRLGSLGQAYEVLKTAARLDRDSLYAFESSQPELLFLANHYASQGMPRVALIYHAIAEIHATHERCGNTIQVKLL